MHGQGWTWPNREDMIDEEDKRSTGKQTLLLLLWAPSPGARRPRLKGSWSQPGKCGLSGSEGKKGSGNGGWQFIYSHVRIERGLTPNRRGACTGDWVV